MKRHHKSEHYRCTECDRIFISTGKKEHEHSTKHVSYMLVPSLDREHAGAAAAASTQRTYEPRMPRESIETVQMRTKYGSMIQDLLRECRNSKNSQLGHTRWENSLTLLNRIFPSDRDIPIARIGPISTMADDADVWYATEDDIEKIMAQNFILHKPTVVRSRQLGQRGQGLDHFLEALNDHFGDSKVDVQDPSTRKKSAVSSHVCDVIDRIREGADIPAGRLPINLLNLKYLGQVPPAPAFLNLRRFDVLPAISSRLEAEFTGRAIAGKRGHAVMVEAREVDLDRSLTFSLFAQRGAFTGFHVDSPDATWVCLEWGLKLWIFATDTNESEMVKFTDEGKNWVPDSVVAIVLEPGDTLIMPSAQLLPHAVLTLADSRMTGGMFMDALRILESIEKLLWISIRPSVSNEPIPLQLLRGWSHLRKLFYDRNQSTTDRARFEKITGLLLMFDLQMLVVSGAGPKMHPLVPHPQGKNAEPPNAQAQYPAESGVVLMHKGVRLPSSRQSAMSLPSGRFNCTQGDARAQLRRPLGDPCRKIANTRYDWPRSKRRKTPTCVLADTNR
ncbi:hypothetical protein VFPFJ_11694 [Purpureocillium lilacinum]|uniref:Uncharacterized protein n=1 Tax=Purpureocillium lilacinum TaxID=33203 RepID=A0A179EXV4_PURLI|nr:hypothetical protein VFPFJ_11694 [Purpureocillium lilacinum]OAQ58025.1 hypothetical protein VFPFJ_11694 [Purpureocillium lilacinum]